jgi:hypothetical protein
MNIFQKYFLVPESVRTPMRALLTRLAMSYAWELCERETIGHCLSLNSTACNDTCGHRSPE